MRHLLVLCFALLLSLCYAGACNESKLAGEGQRPGVDKTGGDKTDDTGHTDNLPVGKEIVAQVGKLFELAVDLSSVTLPLGGDRVQLHVVDAEGRQLPEAIMMWRDPDVDRPEWSRTIGTEVVAELGTGSRVARYEDIFLRIDIPEGAHLIVSVVVAGKQQAVRKHPLRSEVGKYKMKVIYAEPGIRGSPVIEFNFNPGIPERKKGKWYVAERQGKSNLSGFGITATSFSHLPMLTMKLVVHPRDDYFDEYDKCYVALVKIDDNVKADHFGECGI